MRVTTVAVLVVCAVACCNAQDLVTTRQINIVTAVRNGMGIPKIFNADPAHVLVKLKSGISFNTVFRLGMPVARRLDNDWVIVAKRFISDHRYAQLIASTREINFLWKVSDNLISTEPGLDHELVIETTAAAQVISTLEQHNLQPWMDHGFLRVKGVGQDVVTALIMNPDVRYVGLESFSPKEESPVLDLYLGPNKINKVHRDHPEMNGSGLVVSLKERFYNPVDIDLRGRHVPSSLSSNDTSNHATEMATIVAGAGNSFVTGRGVASGASVTSSSFANLFPDDASDYTSLNTFLQNHSYGTNIENFYGALANGYDLSASQNPTILHVFSSGNAGTSNATTGVYTATPGFSNLTGNSKMAKNVLVVGASDTTGAAVSFSSHGPANDGRVKPELVAYSSVGTSNASALVSGVATLLQQAFKSQTGQYPASALVKAVLINTADDAASPGIDFLTGYGSMNAARAVDDMLAGQYFGNTVASDEIKSFDLVVPANARNLKVTLVWTDLPAQVNATKTLVNNLDLTVSSSTGTVLPWILNPSPNPAALTAPPTRGIDNINNIEQVTIEIPAPGIHTISVKASELATANQSFYLAYRWDQAESFQWTYPTASDNFPYNGETGTYFFWESSLSTSAGDLEITHNNGLTWTTIATQLNLSRGYYRWKNPTMKNGTAKARMKVGSAYFETEEFTISRTFVPSLGFNCADSVLLQWPEIDGAQHYEVTRLDGSYNVVFTTQSDTSLVVYKLTDATDYSVQPILASGRKLLRSPSINIDKFGAGCFVTTFIEESVSEQGVMLRLGLGTFYGVSAVHFEHLEGKKFTIINSMPDPVSNTLRFLHQEPFQGLNRYRARLEFINGEQLVSDTVQTYFLTKTPFIVFPNPVATAADLNVYAGKFENINHTFELFNASGKWVRSAELRSDREVVSTENLPPGLYIYRIRGDGVNLSGKVIIR